MRRTLFLLGSLTLLASCDKRHFAALTVQDVAARRGQPNVFIYDNNIPKRFQRGHLPGAKWVDPGHVTTADLPSDKTATLIFYCANPH